MGIWRILCRAGLSVSSVVSTSAHWELPRIRLFTLQPELQPAVTRHNSQPSVPSLVIILALRFTDSHYF